MKLGLPSISIAFLLVLAACGGSSVDDGITTKPPTDTTTPPVGTVQRSTLNLVVAFDPDYASTAATAGVTLGGLTVRVQRNASSDAPITAITESSGRASVTGLLEGKYDISVARPLSAAELAKLPANLLDVRTFAGGTTATVRPGETAGAVVQLLAPDRGSLLISEIFSYAPGPPIYYSYGTYLEVYNNSDTTIALDGILLLKVSSQQSTPGAWATCEQTAIFRQQDYLWPFRIWQFPGGGRDYLIQPGQAKVVAMDAIDHRPASPETMQLDLSAADFELIGREDVDNPFVPNMLYAFTAVPPPPRGDTFLYPATYAMALPTPASRLVPREWASNRNGIINQVMGVPADAVLDVASIDWGPAERALINAIDPLPPNCDPWLAQNFERGVAPIGDEKTPLAMSRKSLGVTASGKEILQRTHNSSRDFEYHQPLLRSLLKKP